MASRQSNHTAGETRRWHGIHCTLTISRPARGIAVMRIAGHDVGEFGAAPMQELERQIAEEGAIRLFIDARATEGASIEVSGEWAKWLAGRRSRCHVVSMLTGSRLVEVTAEFVRRFADLGNVMRIYSDAEAFDRALAESIAGVAAAIDSTDKESRA